MDRAYSTFTITKADEATGTIIGLASTPDLDRHGDIVEPRGAKYSLPMPLLLGHDHNQAIGAIEAARVTAAGLEIVAKLTLAAGERIREVWELIRAGALRGLSIGFMPLKAEPIPGGGNRFTEWDLFEVSVVAVPANAAASIQNIKSYASKPLPALRIHPVRKEGKPMAQVATQIASLEQITAGAFVSWLSRMKALRSELGDDLEAAAIRMGAPRDMAAKLKAAVEGGSTTGAASGLAGSSTYTTAFLNQMRTQSVLARIFADRLALAVPLRTRLMSMGMVTSAAVVGQGLPFPIRGLDYDNPIVVAPAKIGAAVVLTKELWRNTSSAGQAFVNSQLRAAIAAAADRFLFAQLTNLETVDLTVSTFAGLPLDADLRAALLAVLNAVNTRAAGALVWAFSPAAANMMTMVDDPRGQMNPFGGAFLGLPAIITSGLDGARLALIDAAAIGGNIEELEITSATDTVIEMEGEPTNTPITPTGAAMVSLFQTDSVAIKYVLRLGLEPVMDHVVAFINFQEVGGSS